MNVIDRLKWASNDVFDEAKSGIWKNFGVNLVYVIIISFISVVLSLLVIAIAKSFIGVSISDSLYEAIVKRPRLALESSKIFFVVNLFFYVNAVIRINTIEKNSIKFRQIIKANKGKVLKGYLMIISLLLTVMIVYISTFSMMDPMIYHGFNIFIKYLVELFIPILFLVVVLRVSNKQLLTKLSIIECFIVLILGSELYYGIYYFFIIFFYRVKADLLNGLYDKDYYDIDYTQLSFNLLITACFLTLIATGIASIVGARKSDPSV